MKLDPAASMLRLLVFDEVGSTNAEALRLTRAGETGPLWIVARRQTEGRGRRGRTWISEPGNLYASLLLSDPSPPERMPELSFVAALAVHDAVATLAPHLAGWVGLKWPNDVLLDGKKFSGILVEGEGAAVVVGIGINCAGHPQGTAFPATNLAACGAHISPEDLFTRLSATMVFWIAEWNRGAGFERVRADWLQRAAGIGGPVQLMLADGARSGRFETIDERGRLMLRLADGTREAISAGDVVSLSPQRRAAAAAGR